MLTRMIEEQAFLVEGNICTLRYKLIGQMVKGVEECKYLMRCDFILPLFYY